MRTLLLLLLIFPLVALGQNRVEDAIQFATASDEMDDRGTGTLANLIQGRDPSNLHFLLSGHTDSIGTSDYNLALSKNRVEAVANWLRGRGVPSSNIITDHQGEHTPIMANSDEDSRAFNRRVEILMSTEGPFAGNGFAGVYDKELVRKPFPNADVAEERFTVSGESESRIVTKKGSVITIPANAFVNPFGKQAVGKVEVSYREYHTPLEVFVSGIPMHVMANGEPQHFETGGMFSITASQRGMPLDLGSGAEVSMEFVSTGEKDGFDFYFLDADSSGWVMRNEDMTDISPLDTVGEGIPAAVVRYLEATGHLVLKQQEFVSLDELFYTDFPIAGFSTSKGREARKEVKQWEQQAGFETRMSKVRRSKGDVRTLLEVSGGWGPTRPEWASFSSLRWEYLGPMDVNTARKSLHRAQHSDVRLRPGSSADLVTLELKGTDSITKVNLKRYDPLMGIDREKQQQQMERDMARRHRTYAKSFARTEKKRASDIVKQNAKQAREHAKTLNRIWVSTRPLMTEAESTMGFDDWVAHCSGFADEFDAMIVRRINQQTQQTEGQSLVRTLTFDRLGIFNIDIIKQLRFPATVKPEFLVADGEDVGWKTTYLFDANLQGVMASQYDRSPRITLDASNLQMLVVESTDGKVYRLLSSEVKDMNKRRTVKSKMRIMEVDRSKSSLDEIREMLSLSR